MKFRSERPTSWPNTPAGSSSTRGCKRPKRSLRRSILHCARPSGGTSYGRRIGARPRRRSRRLQPQRRPCPLQPCPRFRHRPPPRERPLLPYRPHPLVIRGRARERASRRTRKIAVPDDCGSRRLPPLSLAFGCAHTENEGLPPTSGPAWVHRPLSHRRPGSLRSIAEPAYHGRRTARCSRKAQKS